MKSIVTLKRFSVLCILLTVAVIFIHLLSSEPQAQNLEIPAPDWKVGDVWTIIIGQDICIGRTAGPPVEHTDNCVLYIPFQFKVVKTGLLEGQDVYIIDIESLSEFEFEKYLMELYVGVNDLTARALTINEKLPDGTTKRIDDIDYDYGPVFPPPIFAQWFTYPVFPLHSGETRVFQKEGFRPVTQTVSATRLNIGGDSLDCLKVTLDDGIDRSIQFWSPGKPAPVKVETVGQPSVSLPFSAELNIDPDTLSLKSMGKYITAYLKPPPSYSPADVNLGSILVNNRNLVELSVSDIKDYDNDGLAELMIKLKRAQLQKIIPSTGPFEITLIGAFSDGMTFTAKDTIKIIDGK
jgi:hypothetical protein